MFIRFFSLFSVMVVFLYAEPNIAAIKQAVSANPALLDTPQAEAMMHEKGVSKADVVQKINADSSASTTEDVEQEQAENEISDAVKEENKELVDRKNNTLSKKVNPFEYKSNQEILSELSKKQQALTFKKLSRYAASFYANKNKIDAASLPTPDNYIISTGDVLKIQIYGDRSKEYTLPVNSDGSVELEYIGPMHIGGMEFKQALHYLKKRLKSYYKMSSFNIKMNKYSTSQVSLIGDVKYPGIYNIASFSTVKDLLIAANGIKESSSVRDIVVKRDSKVIATIDFYKLLFQADNLSDVLLKHGDIVVINKAKKLISIDGYINNAAIFELKDNEKLSKLIEYAGGMKVNASKQNITIKRFSNNSIQETLKVSFKEANKFKMKDGDQVYVYPLDYRSQKSVNIYGNIIRPGSYELGKEQTLNALLSKELTNGLSSFFLPETYFEYGVVKSYSNELTYTTKSYNLTDVINGKEEVKLNARDEVFIFSKGDIFSNSYVSAKGKSLVRNGKLQFYSGMTIQDVVNASGINGVLDDTVRVTTYATDTLMPETTFYSLKKDANKTLNPYDEVEVYDYYSKHILEPISISGEVVKPLSVYYEKGMNAQELVDMAGGLTKKAYTKSLSLVRYWVDENQTRQQKVINYDLEKTLLSEIKLEPYDEVKISKILGWDSQDYETVSISGEVHNPVQVKHGSGMSVEDLIIMAGGLTKKAYTNKLEVVRYFIDENLTRQRKILNLNIQDKNLSEIALKAYDEVKIFKIPAWEEKKTVILKGEVKFPGVYSIESGERLSSVIKRAGGYTKDAFLEGAVFTRESIRTLQMQEYNKSLAKIKRQLAMYNAMPANAKASAGAGQTSSMLNEVVAEAKKYQPMGRVSIIIDENITKFEKSGYNIVLEDKDTLIIPGKIDTITVFGEVFNPTSFVYGSDLDPEDYIELASGISRSADEDNIYVVHANGLSEPISKGWCSFDADISKGDTIVVPLYIKEQNQIELWDSVAKLLSSFALTAAAINSLGVI